MSAWRYMVVSWPWEHNQQSVIYIPKSLIMILIERLSLSTMSGCYTGRASWCDKSKRAREKGKGVRKRRKCTREEKKWIAKKGKQSAVKRTVILLMAWTSAMKSSWRMSLVKKTSRNIMCRSQNPMQLLRRICKQWRSVGGI